MVTDPPPPAPIRLERSLPRLLSGPALVVLAGAAAIVFGALSSGVLAIGLVALGVVVVLIGIGAALVLLSVRLEVEEAQIRLRWVGGERVYPLARGAVTRVTVRGPEASSLRPRLGVFGWAVGRARLRGEETIDVIRLASTRTVIVVPTERLRLAIAPHSEAELLEALSDAAQVRQRLAELARAAPASDSVEPGFADDEVEASAAATAEGGELELEPPHALTGIERALLEDRLAAERAAFVVATTPREATTAAAEVDTAAVEAATASAPVEAVRPAARRQPPLPVPRLPQGLGTSVAFVLLPLFAAAAIWGIGNAFDRLPADGTDRMNIVTLALVLGGPATAIGALMARIWWPRLIGVVVTSGLAALVVAARAVLGM